MANVDQVDMETDDIIALTVHRRATEEEIAFAEAISGKHPTSARGTQIAFAQSPDAVTPQATVHMQTPTNPQPRPSSATVDTKTAHCTS